MNKFSNKGTNLNLILIMFKSAILIEYYNFFNIIRFHCERFTKGLLIQYIGIYGLALATSAVAIINSLILYSYIHYLNKQQILST